MLLFLLLLFMCIGCSSYTTITYHEPIKNKDSLTIHEGIVCTTAQMIKYIGQGGTRAAIYLTAPVKVAQAEQEEEWGYFQFPSIGRSDDSTLIVSWQMQADSHKAYGVKSDREYTPMMSKDGGQTWIPQDANYFVLTNSSCVRLQNGNSLQVSTPKAKDVQGYDSFPKPKAKDNTHIYYLMDDLPEELQGVYFNYRDREHKSKRIHATLNNPNLLRYAIDGLMPIVWWGNIKQLADSSLMAGVYPNYCLDDHGNVLPCSISFYRSTDEGSSWDIVGNIPFQPGSTNIQNGDGGFCEPTFEVLADSIFICVMRTGGTSPMYKAFSIDQGKTWSFPEAFTPNGVKPKLMLLKNGILVLVSGRPGIQVRFSFDGTGRTWSDPIDMIPFMNEDGSYVKDVSCGYSSILEAGDDAFYLVYSDFTQKDILGRVRKSVWCRKVSVVKELQLSK